MIINQKYENEKFPNFTVSISFSATEFEKFRNAIVWCVETYGISNKIDSWILNIDYKKYINRWAWQTDSGYYIYLNKEDLAWFLLKWG